MLLDWIKETWQILELSAPWLLFGFFLAGLIHALLPKSKIINSIRKPGLASIIKSSLIGIPLPLCSCSVIPVAVSLRRSGASKGATSSFLVSTPEIGVDSFALSLSLLGLPLSILRLVFTAISAVFTGVLVEFGEKQNIEPLKEESVENEKFSLLKATHYGLVELITDLAPLLIVGFLFAGLAGVLIPDDFLVTDSIWTKPLILLLSFPVYVCATSMTPLAAVMLGKGLSAGAVMIFLLAGPASNVSTMLAVKKEFGTKTLIRYVFGVCFSILTMSYALDLFLPASALDIPEVLSQHVHTEDSILPKALATILALLLLNGFIKNKFPKKEKPCCS